MERGGPCDGLCRFRIHLGTRGDCPLPAGDGDVDLNVNIVVCVPRLVLDGDFNAHSAWNSIREFLGVTVYVFTDRLAFAAADWCFRLHGWPLCRRCWASTSSPTGLPSPPPTGVSACTAGLYAAVVGRLRLHRPAASSAADWCFRLHGWPIMPPLLGVYVFTDRPPRPPPTGASACTAGLLCRRCWASTSSPTGLPSPPPTGVSACTAGLYAAVVGRLRLHRPAASSAADWCFRLHGWPIMPPLLGVYVVTDRPPRPPPTDELGNNINSPPIICLHGWPTTQLPIEDLIVIIGCYIAIDWITDIVIFINILSSLINIANSAAVDGKLRHHNTIAHVAWHPWGTSGPKVSQTGQIAGLGGGRRSDARLAPSRQDEGF
uniref:cysteine dioxygenase n=1 Tax=Oryza sativa subsp. japonica TaxID=39947 RepID=Q6H7D9_ORYSJ|nr:HGWP repeat containing protein-like [Oryza sativa Japonica Group]